MSKKAIATLLFIFIAGCLASYRFGIKLAQESNRNGILEAQAILSLNQLNRYEELAKCMKNGKFSEAAEKLQHSAISERELLADLLNSVSSTRLSNYIEVRSNQSVEELKNYKSSRNNRWVEQTCE